MTRLNPQSPVLSSPNQVLEAPVMAMTILPLAQFQASNDLFTYGCYESILGPVFAVFKGDALFSLELMAQANTCAHGLSAADNRLSTASERPSAADNRPNENCGVIQRHLTDLKTLLPKATVQKTDRSFNPFNEPVAIVTYGTEFQAKVWTALSEIPFGQTLNYGQIADQIGQSNAARAVGSAIGANHVALYIPCHRVVPKSGGNGQFRWGVAIKQRLLQAEAL